MWQNLGPAQFKSHPRFLGDRRLWIIHFTLYPLPFINDSHFSFFLLFFHYLSQENKLIGIS